MHDGSQAPLHVRRAAPVEDVSPSIVPAKGSCGHRLSSPSSHRIHVAIKEQRGRSRGPHTADNIAHGIQAHLVISETLHLLDHPLRQRRAQSPIGWGCARGRARTLSRACLSGCGLLGNIQSPPVLSRFRVRLFRAASTRRFRTAWLGRSLAEYAGRAAVTSSQYSKCPARPSHQRSGRFVHSPATGR